MTNEDIILDATFDPNGGRIAHLVEGKVRLWPIYPDVEALIDAAKSIRPHELIDSGPLSIKTQTWLYPPNLVCGKPCTPKPVTAKSPPAWGCLSSVPGVSPRTDRRNKKRVELRPAEHRFGGALDGEVDDAVDLAFGRQADELPTADAGHPVAAIGIDGATIRAAIDLAAVEENTPLAGLAGVEVIVCRPDRLHGAVAVGTIDGLAIGAEGETIGGVDAVDPEPRGKVSIKTIKPACSRWLPVILHGAGPQTALGIGGAVVKAVSGRWASGSCSTVFLPVVGSNRQKPDLVARIRSPLMLGARQPTGSSICAADCYPFPDRKY